MTPDPFHTRPSPLRLLEPRYRRLHPGRGTGNDRLLTALSFMHLFEHFPVALERFLEQREEFLLALD